MLFVATGGTIDKQPAYLADGVTFDNDSKIFTDTHLPEMLKRVRFVGEHSISSLFMLDSLDMTNEHRAQIHEEIESSDEERIVVTHGTDTMPETARFLSLDAGLVAERTVVLTGAMIPYSVSKRSDALFNVACAIEYARALPSGVYVAMNGQVFEANNVRKDREAGVFKPIDSSD